MLALLLVFPFPASIYAADTPVVQTDKVTINSVSSSYQRGSTVTIAGKTTLNEVTVKVLAPDGTILFFDIAAAASGNYTTTFTLPETSSFGAYQVAVGQGTEIKNATFNVNQGNGGNPGGNNGGNTGGNTGGSQPGTGTNPGKGTTTPNPVPNTSIEIKAADLPKPQNGLVNVNVTIPQNQATTEVLLPVNLGQLAGDSKVQLSWGTAALIIPKEVLESLASLIPTEKQSGSYILLEIDQVAAEQVNQIASSNNTNGTLIQPAGSIVELTLGIKDSSGKVTKLDRFSKPVTVSFQLNGQADPALAGIYYIPVNGPMEYVGGKVTGNTITSEVTHFSKYGVFSYDKTYSDVTSGHWASKVIKELTAKHIVKGLTDTSFGPEKDVTRAEFATMLVRQLNLTASKSIELEDVKPGSWYADAVAAAYSNGIVKGISETKFGPDQKITREEMGVMMVKAFNLVKGTTNSGSPSSFKDSKDISSWAVNEVNTAVKEGLMIGRNANTFAPKQRATRAEASQVIYNLIKKQ